MLECPGSVQIKHLPTGRLLYDSPDGWVRAAGEAHEPRRSHWILKNRLEGHAPLSPGVFYVINSGSGKFLDGALPDFPLKVLACDTFSQAIRDTADIPSHSSKAGGTDGT